MAIKFRETFYKREDGTIVFHAIPKVDGDAPAIDFSDVRREHPSSWPKVRTNKLGPELIQAAYAEDARIKALSQK